MIAIALIPEDHTFPQAREAPRGERHSLQSGTSDVRNSRSCWHCDPTASRDRVKSVAQQAHSREPRRVAAIAKLCIPVSEEKFFAGRHTAGVTGGLGFAAVFPKADGRVFRCVSPGESWWGAVCGRPAVDGCDPAPIA